MGYAFGKEVHVMRGSFRIAVVKGTDMVVKHRKIVLQLLRVFVHSFMQLFHVTHQSHCVCAHSAFVVVSATMSFNQSLTSNQSVHTTFDEEDEVVVAEFDVYWCTKLQENTEVLHT